MTVVLVLALLLQAASQGTSAPAAMQAYADGQAAFAKQENAAALAAFDRAIALDAKNADFHHARCRTLPRLQRHDEAIESCSTALRLRPDSAPVLIDRGHFYINVRKLDLALADLTRVEATKLEDYGLYYHLALALYMKGEFAKAAEAYVGCVRTAPNAENRTSCQAWLALGAALRHLLGSLLLDAIEIHGQILTKFAHAHRRSVLLAPSQVAQRSTMTTPRRAFTAGRSPGTSAVPR